MNDTYPTTRPSIVMMNGVKNRLPSSNKVNDIFIYDENIYKLGRRNIGGDSSCLSIFGRFFIVHTPVAIL